MHLDTLFQRLTHVLQEEREAGLPTNLAQRRASQKRRQTMREVWRDIQASLAPLLQEIKHLPALPPEEELVWAQTVLAMPNLACLEIDTTGLGEEDEIVRLTLVDAGRQVIEDVFICPALRRLSSEASRVNGLSQEQIQQRGLPIHEAWPRITASLRGRFVISYAQEWDSKQLTTAVARYSLPRLILLGGDLREHCLRYFPQGTNLSLAKVAERLGQPLPDPPHQTSVDRALGQLAILEALAEGITFVRQERSSGVSTPGIDSGNGTADTGAGDLDELPF